MHDFLLAKEIIDSVLSIAKDKKLEKVISVSLEIGSGSVPHEHHHDHNHPHDEHFDELNIENVEFGLKSIVKKTTLEGAEFKIKKTDGSDWKITDIEVE